MTPPAIPESPNQEQTFEADRLPYRSAWDAYETVIGFGDALGRIAILLEFDVAPVVTHPSIH